jgi:hypothetical protein
VDLNSSSAYQAVIESVYTGLQGIDCSDYAYSPSDGFRQARYIDPERAGSKHLECWFDLGPADSTAPHLVHDSALLIVHRFSPDSDSLGQARIHAATRAAMDWLDNYRPPNGVRFRCTSYAIDALSAEWLTTTVTLQTRIPRA